MGIYVLAGFVVFVVALIKARELGRASMLNQLPLPACIVDRQGGLVEVNQAFDLNKHRQFISQRSATFASQEPNERQGKQGNKLVKVEFKRTEIHQWGKQYELLMYDPAFNSLTDSLQLLHTVIQNIPDAIGITDHELRYLACNRAFVKPLGIDEPQHLLGRTLQEVADKAIFQKFDTSDRAVLESGAPFHIVDEVTDSDGNPAWIEGRKIRYTDPVSQKPGLFIVARDITEQELIKRELNATRDKFERLSIQDGLTQVGNRRRFNEDLQTEWSWHVRKQQELSLIMCDIDEFKKLNDSYGHVYGDKVLIAVANALKGAILRPGDKVYRYGGEEFAVILSDTDKTGACKVAERIHHAIRELHIPHLTSDIANSLTVSLGAYSCCPGGGQSAIDALMLADDALYQAKNCGRNQTIHARV